MSVYKPLNDPMWPVCLLLQNYPPIASPKDMEPADLDVYWPSCHTCADQVIFAA